MSDRDPADQDLIKAVWNEARELITRLEGTSVQRFAVRAGDTRIEIERGAVSGVPLGPMGPGELAASPAGEGVAAEDSHHAIKAPLVGTFYRSGQPGADPFVAVGDVVEPGQTVAIVEAMKLMNQVTADVKGTVVEILVEDGQWVEFEQPLVLLDDAGEDS